MSIFKLAGDLVPAGDQKNAIKTIVKGIEEGERDQILLGITGSGKTFTMAKVIEATSKPTLILAHNKTLAGQLYSEFKNLFPHNSINYFVSYYDYYQPEAYIPVTDAYIEKDAQINEEIDRLRHAATNALLSRRDVIIIASVSCIYGIGSPEFYQELAIEVKVGDYIDRDEFLRKLVDIQYTRNDYDFFRGNFRVRGDVVEVFPADEDRWAIRIEWFDDEIENIMAVDPFLGEVGRRFQQFSIFPGSHYVVPKRDLSRAIDKIRVELQKRIAWYNRNGRMLEAQRIEFRTSSDLEMLEVTNYCKGIENYSRHLSDRKEGEPPATLLDYFPDDFLLFVDESHQTLPQVKAMYKGDKSRKSNLIEFGFRLPSAFDNRPLKYDEFQERINQAVYVSATPADTEFALTQGVFVEQIIRPTGLLDPEIEVRGVDNQLDNLLEEIKIRTEKNEKILALTLTKRMAEQLTQYYLDLDVKVQYLHSEIDTLERMQILKSLRLGEFDVLVGINLLREGLDLPEVSLVAILDADVQGFLRSETSLFQICGRAARHVEGKVIMYADKITPAMQSVIQETERRKIIQHEYNQKHGITPQTIRKKVDDLFGMIGKKPVQEEYDQDVDLQNEVELEKVLKKLRKQMHKYSRNLEFEKAAAARDRIKELESRYLLQ
ncbi:MAG: excinuclease ABC subunit UvrB [Deltaproteobacteria bacterium]|jgi:excinuclease ABC subunit B|nr:excinuclease ABC subunit UvrB [Deltaproteobacteria bacterium]